jgi:undecaprenyl-diphosphatase
MTGELLDFTGDRAKTFEVFIQLGAILAATLLYWKRLVGFLDVRTWTKPGQLNMVHIFLGILPAGLIGVVAHDFIKEYLFSPYTVLYALIVGALLMIFAEKKQAQVVTDNMDALTYKQALGIGLFQVLALWSGFSRSGSTISGGMLMGVSKKAAADFSFLMAIPLMVGATGLDLVKSLDHLSMDDFGLFATGFVISLIVALVSMMTFLKVLNKVRWSYFAYYRFVVAAAFWYFILS